MSRERILLTIFGVITLALLLPYLGFFSKSEDTAPWHTATQHSEVIDEERPLHSTTSRSASILDADESEIAAASAPQEQAPRETPRGGKASGLDEIEALLKR